MYKSNKDYTANKQKEFSLKMTLTCQRSEIRYKN